MFGLTASFFLVEITVGHMTNSMALISDSFHMLSDIAAIIIAFISVRMAPKSWDKNTYGWARAEVLGALVNAVFLVALCFSITMEALKRFYEPEKIHDPILILWVGAMGLVVNLLGLCLFHEHGSGHSHGGGHGHSHDHGAHSHLAAMADDDGNGNGKKKKADNGGGAAGNLNMRGVFLHVMADALGSVIVIISASIMQWTDWEYKLYVDPGLSLFMVMLMLRSVWPLLIESALILLQTVPTHIDIETLKKKLLEQVDGVLAVHEFHIWQLAGDRIIASAHIRCLNLSEYMKMAENIKEFFHNNGIHSTTIQPEFVDCNGYVDSLGGGGSEFDKRSEKISDMDCALSCPKDPGKSEPNCVASQCCPDPQGSTKETKSEQNTPTAKRRGGGGGSSKRRRNSLNLESPSRPRGGGMDEDEGSGEVQILMPGSGSYPDMTSGTSPT